MIQTLGALTTALATTNVKVDSITTSRTSQVTTPQEQPGTSNPSAVENPSAVPDPCIEEQVRIQATQSMANTDDESWFAVLTMFALTSTLFLLVIEVPYHSPQRST